jgi:hypothetical protein
VVIAWGTPEMEANLSCFFPDWHGTMLQTLSAFLMQWFPAEVVIKAIGTAQSARFEFWRDAKNCSAASGTTARCRSEELKF